MKIQKIFLLISAFLGLISAFLPIIFHISPNYLIQFWPWGFNLFFGLSSSEVGVSSFTELELLIPALFSTILILLCSIFMLVFTLKKFREKELNVRFPLISGIILITTPLILMVSWHFIYTLIRGYPIFWGSFGGDNYYLPSFSLILQLLAGGFALLSSLIIKVKRN